MSENEKKEGGEKKEPYTPPEMVRMGDALEITAGGPGIVTDGSLSKEHWFDPEENNITQDES